MSSVQFNGGDDVVIPVAIEADGDPVDLATGTLTVEVWTPSGKLFDATWSLDDASPAAGDKHGDVSLTEAQSAVLPKGRIAWLKAIFVRTADDVTVSTGPLYLDRVL